MGTNLFDHTWEHEHRRLAGLEATLDPGTIRHLEALGVGEGWRCLEVGAGGGSIARWLCTRVGSSGYVLATDIETRFLEAAEGPTLEVRCHDILSDPLPEAYFDLGHTRWLLHWLPARQAAVRRMVQALRPGGWLLAEEPDLVTVYHALEPKLLHKVTTACERLLEANGRGKDTEYSRRLFDDLRGAGLTDLDADGRVPIIRGGMPFSAAEFLRLTIDKVRVALIDSGAVTADEIAQAQTLLRDPSFAAVFSLTIAVWGRRPLWQGQGA